ncbi:MAG: hypothetical protein V3V08_00305 [Nannocystaceae bacterium]
MPIDRRKLADYALMLADDVRMRAYQAAIAAVCPGRTVCEIGVGLGPLTLMALRAGATHVYGIERDAGVLDLASRCIADAGVGPQRFTPIHGYSHEIELPRRVDVVMSETLDSMGVGENTVHYMEDARRRFLAPNGVFLPSQLRCIVALASPRAHLDKLDLWKRGLVERYAIDLGAVLDATAHHKQTISVGTDEVLSAWQLWQRIDFATPRTPDPKPAVVLPVRRAGVVHGLAFAFDCDLAVGVILRTLPDDPPTHWQQGFWPVPAPLHVDVGDAIHVRFALSDGTGPSVNFRAEIRHIPASLLTPRCA